MASRKGEFEASASVFRHASSWRQTPEMSWTPLIVDAGWDASPWTMQLRGAGQAVVRVVRVFLRRLPRGGEGRR